MHKEVPLQKSLKAELHLDEFILTKMEESKTNSQTTSFDQLVTTFSHHNQLPKVLQPHLNRLLLLSNKRKTEAKNRQVTLEATCDQCLQKYKDLMSLKKHHKQKDCNMGKFLGMDVKQTKPIYTSTGHSYSFQLDCHISKSKEGICN